jgi:hypothetical protein
MSSRQGLAKLERHYLKNKGCVGIAYVVECLLSKWQSLGLIPTTKQNKQNKESIVLYEYVIEMTVTSNSHSTAVVSKLFLYRTR